ncbi:MAG TPA: alpha/beta hydrolase [Actinocrinis sp.]|jgi:pimeloyl-ACP methyl ester carboxylesterase
MSLAQFDSHRRVVETESGPVGCVDIGSGRPALFVHGIGTGALLWRNAISALLAQEPDRERRCIAVDLPLHGRTPVGPGQDLSLTGLAKVVEDFCAALDLTGIDLVANDSGGAVAQIVAAHQPQRLATFTLTNCETQGNVPPRAFKPVVLLARAGLLTPVVGPRLLRNLPAARKRLYAKGYQDVERLPLDVVKAYLEPTIGTKELARENQRWIASLHDRDLAAVEPALRKLDVPTLLVWGDDDVFFDVRHAQRLRDAIRGATEVVTIEGGRVFFPDERAEELVVHLRAHWAAHGAG